MDINTIIAKKRQKGELTNDEIKYFVGKYLKKEITNSQAAALMSYIYINGLTDNEIVKFSLEISQSGDVLDLSKVSNNIVDKHSTGGVGDKITLILLPIIAALGLPVAKISSRAVGIFNGTIDKLAAIPGFNPNITLEEFEDNVKNIGISIVSEDLNLAPVEKDFYRLRNEISCGDCIPLIAVSLISLKLATGSNKMVFDLTYGKGTYLRTKEAAIKLGKLLVRIAERLDREVGYVVTSMEEPVGNAVGNILEIKESIECLKGNMPKDVEETVITLADLVLTLSDPSSNSRDNIMRIKDVINSERALTKFRQMVIAQGGDVEYILNPDKFDKAKYIIPIFAKESGYIKEIDSDIVGSLARYLGAGRMGNEEEIDNTSGFIFEKKIGDRVNIGDDIAYVHANDETKARSAVKILSEAYKYTTKYIEPNSRIIEKSTSNK